MARESSVPLSSPRSLLVGWFCQCPHRAVRVSGWERPQWVWGCKHFPWKTILAQTLIYHRWLSWILLSKRGMAPLKEKKKDLWNLSKIFKKPDLSFGIWFKLRQDDSVCQCLIKNRHTLRKPEVWTWRGWTQSIPLFLEPCCPQDKGSWRGSLISFPTGSSCSLAVWVRFLIDRLS